MGQVTYRPRARGRGLPPGERRTPWCRRRRGRVVVAIPFRSVEAVESVMLIVMVLLVLRDGASCATCAPGSFARFEAIPYSDHCEMFSMLISSDLRAFITFHTRRGRFLYGFYGRGGLDGGLPGG